MDALTARPALKKDLVTIRLVERGEPVYMYKVVEAHEYYRVNEIQHEILTLLDGTRTLGEVVDAFNAGHSRKRIDLEFLEGFLDSLRSAEIFERTSAEKKRFLLEMIRVQRRRRAAPRSSLGSLFEITLPAWDPDRFFERVIPHIRFFWSRGFVIFSACCMLVTIGIWSANWNLIMQRTLEFFTFEGKTGADLLQAYLILVIIGFFHESAHGLTCKFFGGNVNRMGMLFLYFSPCFFVDVSDAYLFDRHSKRQWVIYAGLYIELFICSLASFLWVLTSSGTAVNDIAFKVMLMTGVSSLVFDYNPLIKLDGYYSLMDYLEIPDLWERSFAYVSGWVKKYVFRLPVALEAPTRKVRRILVGYCLASLAYKVFVIIIFMVFLQNVFVTQFGALGNLGLVPILLLFVGRPLSNLYAFLKFNILDKKEVVMKTRSLVVGGAIGVPLLAVLTLVPLPTVVRGDCILEPGSRGLASSSAEGIVERVAVREGQRVDKGEMVAMLRNTALPRRLRVAQLRLELVEREIAGAAGAGNLSAMAEKTTKRDLLRKEVRILRDRVESLTLRAPMAGVVTTPRTEDLAGTYLKRGQPFCEISGPQALVARVPVRESRLDEIHPGQRVRFKFTAFPLRTFPGTVIGLAPASARAAAEAAPDSAPGWSASREFTDFEVIVSLGGPPAELRNGMSGTARVEVGRSTLARRAGRAFTRWIGSRIW